MKKTSFIPDNLYYLESNNNPEEIVLNIDNHSKFINLNLDFESSILTIKNTLKNVLGRDIEYGNACLDFIDIKNEKELLNMPFLDLIVEYDYNVFKNIILVTGLEMNNI